MDAKFSVNLRDYTTVPCECPDCHAHYQLRLRKDHSALATKENGLIKIRCIDCAKNRKIN